MGVKASQDWQDLDTAAEMEAQEAARNESAEGDGEVEEESQRNDALMTTDLENGKPNRNSGSHWGSEPGFELVDGDIEGCGYNDTTVDIIAVPCIGASPIDTWARDPLRDGYFAAPTPSEPDKYSTVKEQPGSSVLSSTTDRVSPKASHIWIRQGIRKEVSQARVMLYRHRELADGVTIEHAADDLLEQVIKMRSALKKARPIFFICHSIGGLVVKSALVKASKKEELRPLVFDCHGITFFGTPHRGSSYLSMPNLRESIQHLLFLERPLPESITEELRLGYKPLLKLHDKFTDIASELRIWTFYETVDSQLSGLGGCDFDEVHFSAPITSIKSGLVGTRAEQTFSLESDHAHCASFGPHELQIMHSYLHDLGKAVYKAESLSATVHTPLRLASKVKVELIGFYEDPDGEKNQDIRLYVSKHYLDEFLEKGPEDCLRERLNTVAARPHKGALPPSQRVNSSPSRVSGALRILNTMQEMGRGILGSSRASDMSPQSSRQYLPSKLSPEIVVTNPASRRPSITGAVSEPIPSAMTSSSPRSKGLTVPPLLDPGLHQLSSRRSSSNTVTDSDETARTRSEPLATDISPRTIDRPQGMEDGQAADRAKVYEQDGGSPRKTRRERVSRASALQEITAGFSRPNPTKRKFMWIHVPFNNPQWVKSIFDKLSEVQNRNYSKLLSNDYWASKHVHGRYANFHLSYVKPGCAFVPAEASSPRPSSPSRGGRSVSPNITPSHFYLYLPYLHYDTYVNIIRRRNLIKRRLKHGRARPVPRDIAELESLESRVIWEYIGHDPPLNARRTLDQYGYPALQDTWARDDDQMLYKLTRETNKESLMHGRDMRRIVEDLLSTVSPTNRFASIAKPLIPKADGTNSVHETETDEEKDIINGPVLMVDQLWMWAIDTTTLMTFFPKREAYPAEGPLFQQADLRNSIYNELNGDLTGRCDNALDLAAFITLHAVTVLLDRTSHPDLEIFRIFGEALGILTERMTSALKRFRMRSHDKIYGESDSDDPNANRSKTIKKRHKREIMRAERQNRENTSALLELRDMEDELHTLLNLFTEQQDTIKTMKSNYEKPELQGFTERGREFLKEALSSLDEYEKQAHDMLTRVDHTRKDYEKLQEMVLRQEQMDDVRWSRLQTELASSQNLAVMIFTTFTVIFLPLSFFTSLFGMNTQEWGGPDPNNFVSLELIGEISLPASAFVIIATLLAAFSSRVQSLFRICLRVFTSSVEYIERLFAQLEPEASKKSKEKLRQVKEDHEQQFQRQREHDYDFWGMVRAQRRSEYEIPEMNRRRATRKSPAPPRGTWSRMMGDD
ncbi:hypothetical protein F5Y19DRAFT_343736 [Xylariaceae sp. FL1651]|nr:hypothetical protein F5Y19DRAFT_343736 [Xylariaceae sp. FL1651]